MAVANAVTNVMRKKGKKPQKLWKKKTRAVIDKEIMQNSIKQVITNETLCGKGWVEKIYKANGLKLKKRGGNDNG